MLWLNFSEPSMRYSQKNGAGYVRGDFQARFCERLGVKSLGLLDHITLCVTIKRRPDERVFRI
jgi:hypothetical protein